MTTSKQKGFGFQVLASSLLAMALSSGCATAPKGWRAPASDAIKVVDEKGELKDLGVPGLKLVLKCTQQGLAHPKEFRVSPEVVEALAQPSSETFPGSVYMSEGDGPKFEGKVSVANGHITSMVFRNKFIGIYYWIVATENPKVYRLILLPERTQYWDNDCEVIE